MKKLIFSMIVGGLLALPNLQAAAADTNPPPRLTVELRDGSRVTGESVEKYFKFRTTMLGEIKLDVKAIRSVECVSSNSAKVFTVSGDALTVAFVDSELALKTSFGKVALPVNTMRKLTVSATSLGSQRNGLVALWSGEGNADDVTGVNNGSVPPEITFVSGQVGRAFKFTGNANITVADTPSLNPTDQITIECWVCPHARGAHNWSQHLVSKDNGCRETRQYLLLVGDSPSQLGRGNFRCNIGFPGGYTTLDGNSVVQADKWYHVAMTYDGSMLKLYVNGNLDGQLAASGPISTSPEPVRIGGGAAEGCPSYNFNGIIDEPTIYNRALSPEQIREDFEAGNKN